MFSIRTFAPWLAYVVVSGVADWRLGAVAAALVAIHDVRLQRREHGDVDDLARATRWYFLALTVLSTLSPDSPVHRFTPALSLAVLGATAADSLLRGRPFTLTFARRTAPPEVWEHPAFVRANVVITRVWAASFLLAAAACASVLWLAPSATGSWIAVQVLGFAVPVAFTHTYRERARARFTATVPTVEHAAAR